MKITDKLQQHKEGSPKPTFSFEYFVPKTTQGVQNLYDRMDRMYQSSLPQFIDITWNAGGNASKLSQSSTELVSTAQSVLGLETCMHLTCTNMPREQIDDALKEAYDSGCQNILALRGDPPAGPASSGDDNCEWEQCAGGFRYARDLVKYIRDSYGDHFAIGVAAYPEGHPEEPSDELNMRYLKEKVDAGATFLITQMFYDAQNFVEWCKAVRDYGIDVPIIPGIMPITTYAAFLRRAQWGNINIPQHFLDKLDPIKDDDELVRQFGTDLVVEMCQRVLNSGYVSHLHLYTMNLEKAPLIILDKLGLLPTEQDFTNDPVSLLPWRKSLAPNRRNEEVRPIFWQRRPYSYVARTSQWAIDEFPNGRFGDSSSPAFGDLDLVRYSLFRQSPKKALELWSTPKKIQDISQLVIDYLQGRLVCLPWSDTPLNHEVDTMLSHLLTLNKNFIITINSQPQINGIRSNDKVHGWGPKDGYVYQKQYLEFLLPRDKLPSLTAQLEGNEMMTYFAIDVNDKLYTNHPEESKANAVTWGIFPGREVLQPTIVEKVSFLAWKEEFYRILEDWKSIFIKDDDKESIDLVQHLIDDYVLVNIVDNDFVNNEDQIFNLLIRL
ncbi:methylenetetrahydrofolate reductase (NAD(P)H) [Maudiozyma humilis]|uniref:Methylenetetrahydrofolate reductase (NAD(P)H) n=1 Tax=Maudiozyma humilis TaxID=51915 RepID=A0AAV5RV56_MAUHU|nr:methylenetetrahydrofolate reductase (NAD(P)H) [Kazachstania humilis]